MLTSSRMLEEQLDWIGRRYRFVTLDELGRQLDRGRRTRTPARRGDVRRRLSRRPRRGAARPRAQGHSRGGVRGHRPGRHGPGPGPRPALHAAVAARFARWPRSGNRALAHSSLDLDLGARARPEPAGRRSAASWWRRSCAACRGGVDRLAAAIEDDGRSRRRDGGGDASPSRGRCSGEMVRAGMIVGSHTRTHAWLTQESPPRCSTRPAARARRSSGGWASPSSTSRTPTAASTAATVTAVAAAGYRFGYTTCTHRDPRHPLLTVPRRMLWENAVRRRRQPLLSGHHELPGARRLEPRERLWPGPRRR